MSTISGSRLVQTVRIMSSQLGVYMYDVCGEFTKHDFVKTSASEGPVRLHVRPQRSRMM